MSATSDSDTSSGLPPRTKKRLIVCCDGSWMDSDNGYVKPSIRHPLGTLQVPSNVTRISRCFKRRCSDGTLQIISYMSGVGTGSNTLDTFTGGAFGLGLSERVREAYSYLCANYTDGDEIILVGFSRGAFTARSVAGIVGNLGLLTREGVESFHPIFKDMQHWMNKDYEDEFPNIPFSDKPKGPNAAEDYRSRLEKMGYTRVNQQNGKLITIKAICVWDTVGSLGIPQVGWLNKIGIRPSNDEFKWHDTDLSDRIENAFHALALDELRTPFSPAVWERRPQNKSTTDLRQVWFPGNHGNCGGGWEDQNMSNITLAWMMDQMASVGVEFDTASLERAFSQSVRYYEDLAVHIADQKLTPTPKWAVNPIYTNNIPVRPWALGAIMRSTGMVSWMSGKTNRTPGLYKNERERETFLLDTNERIHSSVRVRLACDGLDVNDKGTWTCPSLSKWKLKRTQAKFKDALPRHPSWGVNGTNGTPGRKPNDETAERWVWEYAGPQGQAPTDPKQRVMVEEPLGPYERYLLKLSAGTPNVYDFAETRDIQSKPGDTPRREYDSDEERYEMH